MSIDLTRRGFLAAAGGLAALPLQPIPAAAAAQDGPRFKLGTITYNIGAAWDVPTLLQACKAAGYGHVELRTTHAHMVEPDLGAEQRREVKKQFDDAGIKPWSFGTVCEFQSADPSVVKKNVEDCRAFCGLAA
ncbi:MAG: sugar phosphate isomerase/epimerase, partial [Planctomycetaceae bacterium]|nr:sugar phosphate isomerase/epimerase [Planctomycetaceae bacterium]